MLCCVGMFTCVPSVPLVTEIVPCARLQNVTVNLFETTIRVLGGLQSAFLLSGGNRVFLWRALDLGLRLSVRRFTSSMPAHDHACAEAGLW